MLGCWAIYSHSRFKYINLAECRSSVKWMNVLSVSTFSRLFCPTWLFFFFFSGPSSSLFYFSVTNATRCSLDKWSWIAHHVEAAALLYRTFAISKELASRGFSEQIKDFPLSADLQISLGKEYDSCGFLLFSQRLTPFKFLWGPNNFSLLF